GWKTHPKRPGDWRVRGGILTGLGPSSHLFSDRADFENFHLKARVRINDGGNSGLFFRTEFGLSSRSVLPALLPDGYEFVTVPEGGLCCLTIMELRIGVFRLKAVEHEVDHGQLDERLRRKYAAFAVLAQAAALAQPGEGPLHRPANGQPHPPPLALGAA